MNGEQRPGWCFAHAQGGMNLCIFCIFEGTLSLDAAHAIPVCTLCSALSILKFGNISCMVKLLWLRNIFLQHTTSQNMTTPKSFYPVWFHLTLNAKKTCIWKCRLTMSSAEHICKLFKPIFAYRQTVWALIRLLPKGAVCSGSTLFAKMTLKITSRWQSRRQLLWLAV